MSRHNVLETDVICASLLYDTVEDHAADLSPNGQADALSVLAGWLCPDGARLAASVAIPATSRARIRTNGTAST
jgi:hypothetical protein